MLVFTHGRCLDHQMQPRHPECPDRLRAVLGWLKDHPDLPGLALREAKPVSNATLALVHDADYLRDIAARQPETGLAPIDADTFMCPDTLTAAALAAGAVADAVAALLAGEDLRAFCAVRPPGHHAEIDAAMGFCFYNSIAVGAVTALADPAVQRVAVLDFDVHHGNGTVDIFKDRPEVLVCSTFQHPFYPDRGTDVVRPNLVHCPLPAGSGSAEFRAAITRNWLPAIDAHRPDFVLVSAGFDAHRADPLAELSLTEDDFRWVTERIVDCANRHAKGRVVSTLEGGYDLAALAASVGAHLEALAG